MNFLNYEIICETEPTQKPLQVFGGESVDGGVIIRSSDNTQTLYIDGTGDKDWPIYLGITKSRGDQGNKKPVEANDILGGLQVYARVKEGDSTGYNHNETPLTGSLIFKVGDAVDSSEVLIAVKDNNKLSVKLVLDSKGNLKVSGNISAGGLTITDEPIRPISDSPARYVRVIYDGTEYAMPLYLVQ